MNIKILGSGSSGNCYLVESEDTTLLIECGISIKEIKKKLNFNLNIDACLVTHEHKDHCKAVKDLLHLGIPVYMTEGTKEALGIEDPLLKTFQKSKQVDGRYYCERIGTLIVDSFTLVHDVKEHVGFKITNLWNYERLVFITDTMFCPYRFKPDYLMLEVNYVKEVINNKNIHGYLRNRVKETHMSLDMALDLLKKCDLSNLKEIYVMHLSDSNSDEKVIKESIQKLTGVQVRIC